MISPTVGLFEVTMEFPQASHHVHMIL